MLFDEADSELLKTWTIKKLEAIDSDADADVLADYVLALVKTDDPVGVAKANCTENLRDFLNEKADRFVDELFQALTTKSYDPSRPPPKPTAPAYRPPRRAGFEREPPQVQTAGKKRSYHDWDRDDSQGGRYMGGDRPVKQARRGGRGGRQQFGQYSLPLPPTPPPGMPAWDLNNPFASLQAMYQAMGMVLPPESAMPQPPSRSNRCRDYDKKGFCTRGATCPYEHGDHVNIITGDEYDPTNPGVLNVQPVRTGVVSTSPAKTNRSSQSGRGKNWRAPKRSEFSRLGPNYDKSIMSIVVEQIPEENFDEQTVRDFFGDFGNIEQVTLHAYKRVAIVKYYSYDSARAAYDSPKVIFDNRFVKVYWYKDETSLPHSTKSLRPNEQSADEDMNEDEPPLDMAQIAKQQEEAQRRHDERKLKAEEAQKQKDAFEAQVKALEEQKRKMLARVAKKEGKPIPEESEYTKALREQLAKLEAEALTLGIDPHAATNDLHNPNDYSRGRSGYRGRPRGRGGYNASFRGGWAAGRGGAVKRLDNRPKTICVAFTEGTYDEHEEALRSWLLVHASETTAMSKHPSRQDAALIAFEERYLGENFHASVASPSFPLSGKVELSWYAAPNASITNGTSTDVQMEHASDSNDMHGREDEQHDARDLDVADEDDRWG
ncbi:uncharacterized protein MYCFIDRAFT_77525 [Pseudocercospora fijiensis CIRAD86]|uniref:CCCH zinc finger and RRM domain-containing protein n=1 Tax=Pseudocercospora fijiensis (strain CIRAD86) TaxID=383855 RepID=M3A6A5_PSEFD|nr:uncharacterized protein MYCFIDRAFT_77525 [Pseudocercospora fijiensis CIRAD86]EME86639.1 hypothetical protein MYCFIDRAFT_77525 [Pseudocercospora fijiensis CIRAD86]